MSTWRRHRAHRYSRASSIAPPGGEGWTIRNHQAILPLEPQASAGLGAASDMTGKPVESEAARVSSPAPISLQLTSAVITDARGAGVLRPAPSVQVGSNDTPAAGRKDDPEQVCCHPPESAHERLFAKDPRFCAAANRMGWLLVKNSLALGIARVLPSMTSTRVRRSRALRRRWRWCRSLCLLTTRPRLAVALPRWPRRPRPRSERLRSSGRYGSSRAPGSCSRARVRCSRRRPAGSA